MYLKVLTHSSSFEKGTRVLLDYCKENNIDLNGDDVLYFPIDRKISISKEDIEKYNSLGYEIMGKLTNTNFITREKIESAFDISDPFKWEDWKIGNEITCGYEQILNMIFSALINNKKILIIDHLEQNLHLLSALFLGKIFILHGNFSHIILTTYQDVILNKLEGYI